MAFEWVLQVPILVFSIVIHEVSHGWTALRHGDDTAERAGRLTLNPLPHVDPLGTIMLPALCVLGGGPVFGWAKPVPVNPGRLRGKHSFAKVSIAGPLSNVILAALAALGIKAVFAAGDVTGALGPDMVQAFQFALMLNLYLAAFNLVPVHPLDGSKAVSALLPRRLAHKYDQHIPYGALILLALVFTGILSFIVRPIVLALYSLLSLLGMGL